MLAEKTKIERRGNLRLLRIPENFQFEGSEVFISKVGENIVIFPQKKGWSSLMDSLELFTEDFMPNRDDLDQNREISFE